MKCLRHGCRSCLLISSILNMEWHFTHFVAVTPFVFECDQLFFTGCTISLHFPSTFCPDENFIHRILSFSVFRTHQILFIFHFRFTRRNEIFFPLWHFYLHTSKMRNFFFSSFSLSFHITNAGKCNQTVKYSNKRGIINTRRCLCALRVLA